MGRSVACAVHSNRSNRHSIRIRVRFSRPSMVYEKLPDANPHYGIRLPQGGPFTTGVTVVTVVEFEPSKIMDDRQILQVGLARSMLILVFFGGAVDHRRRRKMLPLAGEDKTFWH